MKFNVSAKELLRVLKATGAVMQKKCSLPILLDHLFTERDGKFFITGSSPENSLCMPINLTLDSETDFEKFCLQCNDIIGLLGSLPEQPVEIDVDMQALVAKFKYATGMVSVPVERADEYPAVAKMTTPTTSFEIETKILFPAMKAATSCCTPDDPLRPVFSAVCLDVQDEGVIFVATNGHKLYKYAYQHGLPFLTGEKRVILIHNSLIGTLSAPFAGLETVTVTHDGKHMCIESGDIAFTIRDIEGKYPNYNSVIPSECPYHAILPVSNLIGAARRVSLMASESSNMVRLTKEGMFLNLSAEDNDFSKAANENLVLAEVEDAMNIPDGFSIGCKCAHIIELLGNISTDNVRLELTSNSKPILFKEDADNSVLTELTMPMQLN